MSCGPIVLMSIGITMLILSQVFGWAIDTRKDEIMQSCLTEQVFTINEINFSCEIL